MVFNFLYFIIKIIHQVNLISKVCFNYSNFFPFFLIIAPLQLNEVNFKSFYQNVYNLKIKFTFN